MEIKPLIHYILSRILALLSRVIPKDKKTIMFISTPDFSDNPRYLYEEAKRCLKSYRFVWVVGDKQKFRHFEDGTTIFVQYRTVEYLKWLLRSKYLVLSHGIPYWKSGNQIAILPWHGIPLKAMGNSLKKIRVYPWRKRMLNKTNFFIVPSEFSWLLFAADIQFNPKKVLYFGQPRCDALFLNKEKAMNLLERVLDINLEVYNSVVFYLPTFRDYDNETTKVITRGLVTDGNFQRFLEENNILFVAKPHPNDENHFEQWKFRNIKILRNSDLSAWGLTIYDLLPAVDILVTDYSSVYFDFLLLNRPIVFYIPDLEKYRETRGFLLEPYEKWTPGDKARTVNELTVALKEAIETPNKWERERLWLRDVMFKYKDGKSSERIVKYFWGNDGGG